MKSFDMQLWHFGYWIQWPWKRAILFPCIFFHNISIIHVRFIIRQYEHWIQKSHEIAGAKVKRYFKKDINPMCGNFTGVQRKLAIQNSIFVRSKFICYSTKESFFKSFPFSREDNQRKALHCIAAVEKHNLKSDNLQYNTLVCWVVGTNDSSTKRLMF